jgi:hypothetical protein
MRLAQAALIWAALAAAICVPIAAASASPLLEWRGPSIYLPDSVVVEEFVRRENR